MRIKRYIIIPIHLSIFGVYFLVSEMASAQAKLMYLFFSIDLEDLISSELSFFSQSFMSISLIFAHFYDSFAEPLWSVFHLVCLCKYSVDPPVALFLGISSSNLRFPLLDFLLSRSVISYPVLTQQLSFQP